MNRFDRFASQASRLVARAGFFALCCTIIFLWLPTILVVDFETWNLVVSTLTTVPTFLLVALLQNDQRQFEVAVNAKLDAMAKALVDVPGADGDALLDAVGKEERTGSDG